MWLPGSVRVLGRSWKVGRRAKLVESLARSHVEADADTLAAGRYCGFLLRDHSECVWHGLTGLEVLEDDLHCQLG